MTSTKKKQKFTYPIKNQICKSIVTVFCFCFFITNGYAQHKLQVPEPNLDEMLINIDKKGFTSGILYDKVMPIARLNTFNKKNRNIASKKFFEQALYELFRASNKEKFINYKELRKKYESSENKVNIGILNTSFQELNYNPNNKNKGALTLKNNKFIKSNDKPAFKNSHTLIIAPLKEYLVGNTIGFIFDKNFMFEETSHKKITSIVANFGTHKKYTIYKNNTFTNKKLEITYDESGYKTLIFTAYFEDGSSKTTKGKLHVKIPRTRQQRISNDPLVENFTITSSIPFQGYDESSPIYGELEYRIFYHTNNGNALRKLLKPIIIIDGFDPGDKRKIQDKDSPKPLNEHHSIEEMMIYYKNGQPIDLIEKLRLLGYDVIIVNQPTYTRGNKTIDGGADYIERNALAHVTLYQYLNNTLLSNGSSEELVIVGPSMGGQMSRYALAYMEKQNIAHNTRLWVSIDSPHLGANIPIGIQSMMNLLDVFGGSVAAADFYHNQLKSTASNQQLIEQHLEYHRPDYLNGGSPVYQQYYSNLITNGLPNSNGYPQNLRKIAIVNGSIVGNYNGVGGQEDFRIHGFVDQFWWDIKVAEMNTRYMPNNGNKQVARLWRKWKPLRTASYTNTNTNGSMDVVPGGFFNSEDQLHDAILGQSVGISDWSNGISFGEFALAAFLGITGDHFESRTNKEIHTFIPTVSALGIKNASFNWGERMDFNLLCNNSIPFDSFYGPKNNEQHTSFTEASVNWLLEELAGNPQNPPNYAKPSMIGDPEVYVGQTVTYRIPKVAKAASYIWDLDFNCNPVNNNTTNNSNYIPWQILSGQGTNSITVKAGSPCVGVISCKPKNSCGTGSMTYKYVRSYSSSGGGGGGGEGGDNPCDDVWDLKFYPNPIEKGSINVNKFPVEDPCDNLPYRGLAKQTSIRNDVKIFDFYGNLIYKNSFNSNEFNINGLKLRAGHYILSVQSSDGQILRKLITAK